MKRLLNVLAVFVPLILNAPATIGALWVLPTIAEATEVPKDIVQTLWGKEFARCFLDNKQSEEYEKKWVRYRVLTRARYNILAKSYFYFYRWPIFRTN